MKIIDHLPRQKFEKIRNQYDFCKLKVDGGAKITDAKEWRSALKQAHTHACKQKPKWKVSGHWYEDKGYGLIRRLK